MILGLASQVSPFGADSLYVCNKGPYHIFLHWLDLHSHC